MPIKFSVAALILFGILSAACDVVQVRNGRQPTGTTLLVTSTLPTPPTQAPSVTPLPSPQPTLAPVDGATSTQVNVRAEPSTAGNVLGIIPADTRVEITGKDPGGHWWQINYPQGVDGKGWVTAQYVVAANQDQIPIIGGTEADIHDGPVAVMQQQINVRSGPGTDFNSLGTLNPQDVARLTGKDPNGAWLQIDFPPGPGGKGWVNAAFVRAQGVETLPILTEAGVVVGTGTPTAIPPTPTATIAPARADNDSATNPITSVVFDAAGTQTLIYNGDLSSPQGDSEDWVAFKPYVSSVYIRLECVGNGSIQVEILENTLPTNTYIECGELLTQVPVKPDSTILVHIQAASADVLQYTNYILTVKTRP